MYYIYISLIVITCVIVITCGIIYITKNTPIKAKVDKYLERYVETQRNTTERFNPNTSQTRPPLPKNTSQTPPPLPNNAAQTPPPLNPNTLRNHSTEIQFQCDHCNSTVFVYKHLAGTQGKCPNCGHKIQIPH